MGLLDYAQRTGSHLQYRVLFIDAVRQQQLTGKSIVSEADINSFQKIAHFQELDARGLGSAFATQFLWKPSIPDHEHYDITITWRDGSVSEDLAIERIENKWLWAMTVKDRANGTMLAECNDPGISLGASAKPRCFPEMTENEK